MIKGNLHLSKHAGEWQTVKSIQPWKLQPWVIAEDTSVYFSEAHQSYLFLGSTASVAFR